MFHKKILHLWFVGTAFKRLKIFILTRLTSPRRTSNTFSDSETIIELLELHKYQNTSTQLTFAYLRVDFHSHLTFLDSNPLVFPAFSVRSTRNKCRSQFEFAGDMTNDVYCEKQHKAIYVIWFYHSRYSQKKNI